MLIGLLVLAMYVGVSFGRVYFRYFRYKDDMGQAARFASQMTDDEIRARLAGEADSLGLPADARSVHIVRIGRQISISATYTEVVKLPFMRRVLHFAPNVRSGF